MSAQSTPTTRSRFAGCLLAGAVGDALGAPVEFLSRTEIIQRFGPGGITDFVSAYGGIGKITDDTQMTLFTAEGLLRAYVRGCKKGIVSFPSVAARAYLRWLTTQGERPALEMAGGGEVDGWLIRQNELHDCRAPGNTCLAALREMRSLGEPARNDSKGCGGVMRVAPVGLFTWRQGHSSPQPAFDLANELAALTHGHPTGVLASGALAVLIHAVVGGSPLPAAIATAKACLRKEDRNEETLKALEQAELLASGNARHEEAIAALGKGWVAEEALAISVYCALVARDLEHGVITAVNHDGDSDSTGAIAGNLLGAMHGVDVIPRRWLEPLELKNVIGEVAEDLHDFVDWPIGQFSPDREASSRIWEKYPGW